ncbi:DNA recombination protein RecN [Dactylosporangium sp. AC04546]|uniref:DNA recombination protein RecN n=1 Tax=Dactylosporangium sp. AC04546 TaxID=2862460 RepID=UPI001EDE13F1|nr:DNA recombination protein RecN [Dactylosporangium sp. AC04546]WVK87671.1 DNA recombination protein RecN [Dactylosporangium sp. AC04546]
MIGLRAHGIRLRRLRLHGGDRTYDVDFRASDDSPRPLSVLAGAFSTGKTTILEFVDYCLGASDHPRHPEIMPKVKAATLEVELSGSPYLVERTVGEPSMFAYVRPGRLDELGAAPPVRRPLRPAGNPESLSSMLLSHCKLQGVRLSQETEDPLSFRDLMWLCFLPNERLDDKDLLFESVPMKHLKLRQVVDVVFDVHDDHSVEIGRRIRNLEAELGAARTAYRTAEQLVDEQRVGNRGDLEALHHSAKDELAECAQALAALDTQARADTRFAEELRERHHAAAQEARTAAATLRDRETQLQRMTTLRGTYADDVSKWTMLAEAERLFEPMRVTACPSCLAPLAGGESHCPACRLPITGGGAVDVSGELRSARTRLGELTRYLEELEAELPGLRIEAERAQEAEARAAAEVDAMTAHAVTPYLAQRDALARRREEAAATLQRAVSGLRLVQSLERRANGILQQMDQIAAHREELSAAGGQARRASRSAVVRRVGERYREILAAWKYPKLADAYLAEDLTPYMRGEPYTAASSGGRTLIALAWQLALFEIAWESRSSHPGFLLLDSPQKNLGVAGDLADSQTIERIYRHLEDWLAGRGVGAQIVVADNAPPPAAAADVIVRFTRRPDQPPYGLIDDETG